MDTNDPAHTTHGPERTGPERTGPDSTGPDRIGVVIIGRNEGARLIACIKSARAVAGTIVYVDSGSDDGSVEAAAALGAQTVSLDMSRPFTAARARNAGYRRLKQGSAPEFVQFVDGDCEIVEGWMETAAAFLRTTPEAAAACGRRREKFPERTIYNRLCDREWDTPVGEALACGGDVLIRAEAFEAVGGYRDSLIAGEEPELCVRLRAAGWRIHRLDAEMTRHDIAMTNLRQWLKRARRAGHAYAEVSRLHRDKPEGIWARETLRAVAWSAIAPVALIAGLFAHPAGFALLLAYPLQVTRMALRGGGRAIDWAESGLSVLSKFAEARGVLSYRLNLMRGKQGELIEYKS